MPSKTIHDDSPRATEAIPAAPLAPQQPAADPRPGSLEAAAAAIRRDACQDPVAYLLRSDTLQHGE